MSIVLESIDYLNKFSEDEGIVLFNNVPLDMPNLFAPEGMGIEAFLNLSKVLGCKIIYYKTIKFSAVDLEYPEEDDDEDYGDEDYELLDEMESGKKQFVEAELLKLSNKWTKKLSEPKWIEILFYYDGVSHLLNLLEPWYMEYRNDIDALRESAKKFIEKGSVELESLKENLKEEIEKNMDIWSKTVAEDKEFQKTKANRARGNIVIKLFPGLVGPRYYAAIDEIIKKALVIAEDNLMKAIYGLRDQGQSVVSISANLDISSDKVRKMLAKVRD